MLFFRNTEPSSGSRTGRDWACRSVKTFVVLGTVCWLEVSLEPRGRLPFWSRAGLLSSSPQPAPTFISSHFRVLIFFFSFSLIFQSDGFHLGTLIDLLNFFRFRSIFCSANVLVGPRLSSTTSFTRRCSRLLDTSNTPSPVLERREELQHSSI